MAKPVDADDNVGRSWRTHQPLDVIVLDWAIVEGHDILDDFQYWLVVEIVRRLVDFGDRPAIADLEIAPFGDFWELKLKGGFLKKINLRIYFAHAQTRRQIVVLKTYKKEEDHQTSRHITLILENRFEDYLEGACRDRVTVFRAPDISANR